MKKFLLGFFLLSFVYACNSDDAVPLIFSQVIIVEDDLFANASTDDFSLINAEVNGDSLKLIVQYGGGCGNIGAKVVSVASILKLNPPQKNIRLLFHDNDDCEALLSREVAFDLTPLRFPGYHEMGLRLEGWDGELVYRF